MKQNIKVIATEKFLIIETQEKSFSFSWQAISSRLAKASNSQRSNFVISPSGYGIHWSDVDEDLSLPALLGRASFKKTQTSGTFVNEPVTAYHRKTSTKGNKPKK
jgi:uncharacterized protein DUF2442